jgi:dTMP kinase
MRLLICFAGLDGSGKTTQARLTSAWMNRHNMPTEFIRFHTEPTKAEATEIVGKARQYMIDHGLMVPVSDIAFLKEAFHIEMKLRDQIQPALAAGKSIIFDRYVETFDAFSSITQKHKNWVRVINPVLPKPDISFFLDVPPEICFGRIQKSERRLGDHETIESLQKARAYYLSRQHDYAFTVLDGSAPAEQLNHEVQQVIMKHAAAAR